MPARLAGGVIAGTTPSFAASVPELAPIGGAGSIVEADKAGRRFVGPIRETAGAPIVGADEATPDTVQVARLQVDTHKWRAKTANPKQYGDKVDLTSAGARIGLEELVAGSMERKPA